MNGPEEQHTYRYDPELPFMYELEHEVRRRAERAARAHSAGHTTAQASALAQTTSHPLRTRHRASHASQSAPRAFAPRHRISGGHGRLPQAPVRIARRSLILVALLCLIGASAYGASQVFSGGASNPTTLHQGPFVSVAEGHAGSDAWSLRLYTRDEQLCRVLVVAETESSRCAPPPGPRSIGAMNVASPLRRYVFGVAGGEVARVVVHAGGDTVTVSTHTPNPARAHAAGLPTTTRWFLAVLPRPAGDSNPPALVRGLDSSGRFTGPPRITCAQMAQSQSCSS